MLIHPGWQVPTILAPHLTNPSWVSSIWFGVYKRISHIILALKCIKHFFNFSSILTYTSLTRYSSLSCIVWILKQYLALQRNSSFEQNPFDVLCGFMSHFRDIRLCLNCRLCWRYKNTRKRCAQTRKIHPFGLPMPSETCLSPQRTKRQRYKCQSCTDL